MNILFLYKGRHEPTIHSSQIFQYAVSLAELSHCVIIVRLKPSLLPRINSSSAFKDTLHLPTSLFLRLLQNYPFIGFLILFLFSYILFGFHPLISSFILVQLPRQHLVSSSQSLDASKLFGTPEGI